MEKRVQKYQQALKYLEAAEQELREIAKMERLDDAAGYAEQVAETLGQAGLRATIGRIIMKIKIEKQKAGSGFD